MTRIQYDSPAQLASPGISVLFLFALVFGVGAIAQTPAPVSNPDAKIVVSAPQHSNTPAQLRAQAWSILSDAVGDDKHGETRVQALAAVGLLGNSPRGLQYIRDAFDSKDIDIRVAAVLAAGQTMAPALTTDLRDLLDDKEAGVVFSAALTLWKMHDYSGEDILIAVAEGDRKTSSSFMTGTEHQISKQLHDPVGLAKYGAMQGAYLLLGPFGYGLSAFEYLHKNGGDSARVTAIEAIAQNHTASIRSELIEALDDKDFGVRTAAAKALSRYRDADVPPALARLFDDTKPPVRLTAAAAYLVSTGAAPGATTADRPANRRAKH
jgi:HEAT repeat protein